MDNIIDFFSFKCYFEKIDDEFTFDLVILVEISICFDFSFHFTSTDSLDIELRFEFGKTVNNK